MLMHCLWRKCIITNFYQLCGSDSVCIVEDSCSNIISQSSCTGINPINSEIPTFSHVRNLGIILPSVANAILVVLLILFITITVRFLSQRSNTQEINNNNSDILSSYQIK